ncbi:hypothetical protein GJU40_19915 [Bacillus lacus]|uniref:Uncharacterized protein n=1 Tax=Metabacillus lacus TaxID=1983721 RepID=A0A7X2LZ88_9BACI|nr:hypothetical protein [Metabacillus lacus]MRX74390.1 hypothetical protein [Metabacillus lacus]
MNKRKIQYFSLLAVTALLGAAVLFFYLEREPAVQVPEVTSYLEREPYYISFTLNVGDSTLKTQYLEEISIPGIQLSNIFVIESIYEKFPDAWNKEEKMKLPLKITEGVSYDVVIQSHDPAAREFDGTGFLLYFNDYFFEKQ